MAKLLDRENDVPMNESNAGQFVRRLVRGGIGVWIGWTLASLVIIIWLVVGAIYYGDMDAALQKMPEESFAGIVFGTICAGAAGCWIGASVTPVVIEDSPIRRPVLTSSLLGGTIAGVISTGFGFWLAHLIHDEDPKSHWVIFLPATNGVLLGIVVGWRLGRRLSGIQSRYFESITGPTSRGPF